MVFGTGAGQRVKEALGRASPVDPRTPSVLSSMVRPGCRSTDADSIHFQAVGDIRAEEQEDTDDKKAAAQRVHENVL